LNYCGNYQSAGGRRKRREDGKLADFDGMAHCHFAPFISYQRLSAYVQLVASIVLSGITRTHLLWVFIEFERGEANAVKLFIIATDWH
jgi:hypothetical protein